MRAVDRYVHRAVTERRAIGAPATSPRVPWRERIPEQRNDHDRPAPVIAHAVDVVPLVTAVLDGAVQARSDFKQAAANRPLSAAIGTPGPGCTLPPAR